MHDELHKLVSDEFYLVGKELDTDAMLIKPVFQSDHVFSTASVVLDDSDHFTILEDLLQIPLQK